MFVAWDYEAMEYYAATKPQDWPEPIEISSELWRRYRGVLDEKEKLEEEIWKCRVVKRNL